MRIVETLDELETSRLATAGPADECHGLAPIDLQIQTLQHLHVLSSGILEVYVLELDLTIDGWKLLTILAQTIDRWHAIKHLENRRG